MKSFHLHASVVLLFLAPGLFGCGGSNSGSAQRPNSTDFTLTAAPTSISVHAGSSATVSITSSALNGFAGTIALKFTGLPGGLTATPTSFSLPAQGSQQVAINASATMSAGTNKIMLTGISGALTHTVQLSVAVTASAGGNPKNIGRTHYVHTGAATFYEGFTSQQYTVFDPVNRRFFVADPALNRITVLDAATQKFTGSITVPGAFGIDETPDHTVLYAGTQIGDVYAINPATLAVTHRYTASTIGPYGYQAYSVRVLADGRLVLLGGQGGIPGVDGYSSLGVWSPTSNTITFYASEYGGGELPFGVPRNTVCGQLGDIGGMTLTGDRTHILISSADSDGTFCSIDPASGHDMYSNNPAFSDVIIPSPDGRSIILESGQNGSVQAYVLDAATLVVRSHFSIGSGFMGGIISPDSSTLYAGNSVGLDGNIVYAYNLSTGAQVGWLPGIYVPSGYSGLVSGFAVFGTMDDTGLIVGPIAEGTEVLDTTAMRQGAVGETHLNGYLTPATGPAAGGTEVQWAGSAKSSLIAATIGDVAFTNATQTSNGLIMATTPAGTAGPADVYSFFQDGGALILPRAFSYGPSIVQLLPNAATAGAAGTGVVFGYGLGSTAQNAATPGDLSLTVGGKTATIQTFVPNAYGTSSPPFLLQAAVYSVPASANGAQDVVLSTSSGSATASGAMQILPAIKQYPLSGATLAQGIYDAGRDLYYFTDTTKIQIFSKTQGAWLTPVTIPPPTGAKSERLWSIALSPDGSKLAIGDAGASAIYLVDPGTLSVVKSFTLPSSGSGTIVEPAGLAISDAGMVYYTAAVYGGTGYSSYFTLDTSTGTFKDLKITGPQNGTDSYLRAQISRDNTRVFFNNDGAPFSIDTSTGLAVNATSSPSCCYGDNDLSLSSNQTSFAATGYEYDSNLNAESYLAPGIYDPLFNQYVYGEKLSPDGSLLFQPAVNGIDVYDGRLGTLLESIALPVALSQNFDALVSDGKDNVLIAITGSTGTGIAVVDLTTIAEPNPLPYFRVSRPMRRGLTQAARTNSRNSLLTQGKQRGIRLSLVPHITNHLSR